MGDKVVVNAIVTEKTCLEQSPDPVEKGIPGLYPACVVTRAMSKKKENSERMITLVDNGQVMKGASRKKPLVLSQLKSLPREVCPIRCQRLSLFRNNITTTNF